MAGQKTAAAKAVFGLLVLFPAISWADNVITWMEAEFPPGYIHEGPFRGMGYQDIITTILKDNLPDYTHNRIVCSLSRMNHEFQQGKPVCSVSQYKTPERENLLYFSIPSTFTFPNRLIILKNRLKDYDHSDQVSLDDLLKKEVRIGISRDRSYGAAIDSVLDKYSESGKIFVHSGKDVFESLLKMLLMGRLDFMLGLPEEAVYVAKQIGAKDKIATIGIVETNEKYDDWMGYAVCSKTDWGKQVIRKINRILIEQRRRPAYRSAYERWLDANSIRSYRKLYNDIFLQFSD
jgi:uncharacterized protein (TIGR02285 family)